MNPTDIFADLNPEEKLKAENEILRLRLGVEFGMQSSESATDEKLENEWLNYIYEFETQWAENKQIKVYDKIGQPSWLPAEKLEPHEIRHELHRLLHVMEKHGLDLQMICEYDDEVIYRFLTTELFEKVIEDLNIAGMTTNFIYEEFHPNHEYDIERLAADFIQVIITQDWNEYHRIMLAKTIRFNDHEFAEEDFIKLIYTFQEENLKMRDPEWKLLKLEYDVDHGKAFVEGALSYRSERTGKIYEGIACLDFTTHYDFWCICSVKMPGFGG
jgi:hypothetical protein